MDIAEETLPASNERYLYILQTPPGDHRPKFYGKLLLKPGVVFPKFSDYLTDLIDDEHPETQALMDKRSHLKEDIPFGELQLRMFDASFQRLLTLEGCFNVMFELYSCSL